MTDYRREKGLIMSVRRIIFPVSKLMVACSGDKKLKEDAHLF